MKTTENKGFGIVGVRVELSFIELLLIREQLGIIVESNLLDMNRHMPEKVALTNVVNFCEKMIYSNLEEGMKRAGEELFSPLGALPLASDEDLKNECDLNAIENETHQ